MHFTLWLTYTVFLPLVLASPIGPQGVGLTYLHCGDVALTGSHWYYDWSASPVLCGLEGTEGESVPMMWGATVPSSVGGSSPYLLVFNEPNNPGQANLSPAQAATLVAQVHAQYPAKRLIVGGTYDGYSSPPLQTGISWLTEFAALNTTPIAGIHFHCYHWYASECIAVGQQMLTLAAAHNWDVWVTEFAFWTMNERSQAATWQEAQGFITWLKSQSRIKRYAWFASRINGDEWWANPPGWNSPLVASDGTLTYWGQSYSP